MPSAARRPREQLLVHHSPKARSSPPPQPPQSPHPGDEDVELALYLDEDALATLRRHDPREGLSEVVLDFGWGTDIDRSLDDVREKLDRAVLPTGAVSIRFGGGDYFVHGGVWFRPFGGRFVVTLPPIGIVVPLLPPAYATLWIGGAKGQRFRAVVAGRSVAAPVAPDPRDLFGWFAVNKDKWFTRVSNDNTSSVVGPAMITTLTGSWTFHSFKGAIGGFKLEGGCFYLLDGNSLNAEAGGGVCSGFVLSKTSVSGYVGPNW